MAILTHRWNICSFQQLERGLMLCPSRPLESPWVWPSRLKMSTSFAAKKVPHEQVGMGQDWGLQMRGAYVQGFLIEFICILDVYIYMHIYGAPDIDLHLESDPKLDHISSDRWHPQYQSLKCGWDTTPCGSFWKERRLEHIGTPKACVFLSRKVGFVIFVVQSGPENRLLGIVSSVTQGCKV